MAKMKSSFINMLLCLVIISAVASTTLAYVNSITLEPIAQARKTKQENALKVVLPPFVSTETEEIMPPRGKDKINIHKAYDADKNLVGFAVESYTEKGFKGHIGIMVGFLPDGSIYGTNVVEHKETAGYGTGMSESPFKDQFPGKNPATFKLIVKKDGGDVDAISAATISSRAFCDALQLAYDALKVQGGLK